VLKGRSSSGVTAPLELLTTKLPGESSMANLLICSIKTCDNPLLARGLCGLHYQRFRNNGDPLVTKRRVIPNHCGKAKCPAAKKIFSHFHYIKNSEKIRKKHKEWWASNPDRANSHSTNRRARKKQAMPSWLTPDHISQINEIYAEAKRLSVKNGIAYHVDHIVPLSGKIVCGLHVPWNLRAIPGAENLRRSRTYTNGMG
jgi:hypothetical protein